MMNTDVKPESMLMARYLCVASLATPFKLMVMATKTSPASVAEPVPTRMKKLLHCSALYVWEATTKLIGRPSAAC